MSSFRIFILVLLTAAVGGMFFIICKSQSDMEAEYNAYLVSKRSDEMTGQTPADRANAAEDDKTGAVDDADEARIATKREEQRKAKAEQEEAQFREQERRTLEEQARREQAQREKAERAKKEEEKIAPVGRVYSFDEYEACLTVEPLTQNVLPSGLNVMIVRNGRAVAEATIDSRDESGLYFAYVKDVVISSKKKDVNPQPGDQVVIVDLPSAEELRSGYKAPGSSLFPEDVPAVDPTPAPQPAPAPAATPTPAPQPQPQAAEEDAGDDDLPSLPEVDATLTPLP